MVQCVFYQLVCLTMSKQGSQSSGHDQKTQAWSQHQVMHLRLKQEKKCLVYRSVLEHTYYGEKRTRKHILTTECYILLQYGIFYNRFFSQLLFKIRMFLAHNSGFRKQKSSWITNVNRCMWKMCSNCSCKLRNMLMALAVVEDRLLVWHIARKNSQLH